MARTDHLLAWEKFHSACGITGMIMAGAVVGSGGVGARLAGSLHAAKRINL